MMYGSRDMVCDGRTYGQTEKVTYRGGCPTYKNEKHTPKWAQKYPKMALNRGKNDVKDRVVTIIVLLEISVQTFMRKFSK